MTGVDAERDRQLRRRRDQHVALGCAFAVATIVAIVLIVYLWTL